MNWTEFTRCNKCKRVCMNISLHAHSLYLFKCSLLGKLSFPPTVKKKSCLHPPVKKRRVISGRMRICSAKWSVWRGSPQGTKRRPRGILLWWAHSSSLWTNRDHCCWSSSTLTSLCCFIWTPACVTSAGLSYCVRNMALSWLVQNKTNFLHELPDFYSLRNFSFALTLDKHTTCSLWSVQQCSTNAASMFSFFFSPLLSTHP